MWPASEKKNMWALGYLGHRFQTLGLQHFSLPRTVIPEAEAVRKCPSGGHPPGSEPLSYRPLVDDWFQWMIQFNSLFINQWPRISNNIQELEGIIDWKGWSYSELLKGPFFGFPIYYHLENKWDREIVCPMFLVGIELSCCLLFSRISWTTH